ncbi:phage terminase small subunit P27 family [Testudinibacter sp. TR-2022]|uniref:phage terminase small subunit P27 family n=1 Tax=Testudinibacter sp. TR-2022 TaxID=2585029 RepID=UPI00111A134B|nr:phage terminase small subunit P27 family [Testudinibacter sp. TR-2022]TNH04320.1 phage terminase small subunit P27 family [Pasteurellaceae bacterium Phil31]TNH06323.1 phage terminase small subunit P27 family [Pasteurellaceae bacterium Phil11]TNH05751.1 phage terminase small subunit P27 family [Testudinibacter sp. TR-2022]TNH07483.1 phage terminase small subunit P27 family [Testudinibacter sp. TR-2022]TNH22879.1 phage terminase small subunit P27 family [Testudinibacter sp. TR-2022]
MTRRKTPKAPDYLDDTAKAQWKARIKQLFERGDIQDADLVHLEMYCLNYSLYRRAVQDLAERGFSITNSQGTEARNPALTAKADAEKIMIKMSSLLGFDPVSRRRTPIETEEVDELDRLSA